jgi:non-specific serine/threonine protein kinase
LLENKQDPGYPFTFMATYVSELNAQDTPKYHPLGQALEQLYSEKNKPELIHLLSPLSLASQYSPVIKELIASDDIYHPLAQLKGSVTNVSDSHLAIAE